VLDLIEFMAHSQSLCVFLASKTPLFATKCRYNVSPWIAVRCYGRHPNNPIEEV